MKESATTSASHGYSTHSAMKVLHTFQFLLPSLTHSTSSSSFQSSLSHIWTNHVLELENHILQTCLEELKTVADAEWCLQEHWQPNTRLQRPITLYMPMQMSRSLTKWASQLTRRNGRRFILIPDSSPVLKPVHNLNLRNVSGWPKNRLLHKSSLTEKWQRGSICWNGIITLHSRLSIPHSAHTSARMIGHCSSTCIGQHWNHSCCEFSGYLFELEYDYYYYFFDAALIPVGYMHA